MKKVLRKIIKNGVTYWLPEGGGGGGGDLDTNSVNALIDMRLGDYDSLFQMKSGLYKILNSIDEDDELGLTSGETRDDIIADSNAMSKISHCYAVMCYIVNSEYAVSKILGNDNATKEISECWNSITILAENELARNIYLNSEYGQTYLNNYEIVQNAFDSVYNSLLGKDLIGFLCIQSYYTKIMNNTEKKNSLKVLSLNNFLPVFKAYTDIADYRTLAELESNTTDLNKVINNTNCKNLMQLAIDFIDFVKRHISMFVNNSSVMQTIARDSGAMTQIVDDTTTMNVIGGSSTAMSAMANSAMALNKIIKSSTAIAAITSSANNSRLQAQKTTIYNTVTGNSSYFTQKYRGYADGVSSLTNQCTTANCIVMACLGTYSGSGSYSILTHSNNVQAAKYNTPTRPNSVTASNCNGISFTNCTFSESGDGYAAAAVYQAI